ncbi:hypothetical protein BZB76_4453 [Actinomadura pelletieri DSM 43383]|uniref:Uncharacterized protein n=1 Tax=Actinomadura pelletieri DSM 43383 TaxID=1120940 RepID=A0A495QHN9_9ACTN|nr:hypothetical protein [Actinomadura pelletieri]RKS71648.1 hypothetical protein BZB76_4453 [Actinomadura pelletieri DSM 43383]
MEITPPAIGTSKIASLAGLPAPKRSATSQPWEQGPSQADWWKNSTWVTYETWISPNEIEVQPGEALACGSLAKQVFAGDGRGSAFNSGKYRTRAAIKYDWDKKIAERYKDVHATHRLRPNPEAKTASDEDFDIELVKMDGNFARLYIRHDVGNPFCPISSIAYTSWQELYKNGERWFYGSHTKMPHHEIFQEDWYTNGTDWKHYGAERVHYKEALHPICLAVLGGSFCGMERYQYQIIK